MIGDRDLKRQVLSVLGMLREGKTPNVPPGQLEQAGRLLLQAAAEQRVDSTDQAPRAHLDLGVGDLNVLIDALGVTDSPESHAEHLSARLVAERDALVRARDGGEDQYRAAVLASLDALGGVADWPDLMAAARALIGGAVSSGRLRRAVASLKDDGAIDVTRGPEGTVVRLADGGGNSS